MSVRAAWRWCAAAGLLAFLCSWAFGRIPGLIACGPTGGLGPIIAFEFVRSPADVAVLFGADPCRSMLVAAQQTGLLLDEFGFIPAYTSFLVLGAWAAGMRRVAAAVVIAALAFAGLADEIEGVILYLILRNLPGTPLLADILWWPVHLKFGLLALGTAGIGGLLIMARRWLGMVAGLGMLGGGLFALYGLTIFPAGSMMSGFTVAWFMLLGVALVGSVRPSLFRLPDRRTGTGLQPHSCPFGQGVGVVIHIFRRTPVIHRSAAPFAHMVREAIAPSRIPCGIAKRIVLEPKRIAGDDGEDRRVTVQRRAAHHPPHRDRADRSQRLGHPVDQPLVRCHQSGAASVRRAAPDIR